MANWRRFLALGMSLIVFLGGAAARAEHCPRQLLPFLAVWQRMAKVKSPWYGARVSEIPGIIALRKVDTAIALNFGLEELEKAGLAPETCRAFGEKFIKIKNLGLHDLNPDEFSFFFPLGWLDGTPLEKLANLSGQAFMMTSLPFAPETKELLKLVGWSPEMLFAEVFLHENFYLYQLSNFAQAFSVYKSNFYTQCRKSKWWLSALKKELKIWRELNNSLEHMRRALLLRQLRRIVAIRTRHISDPQVKACWQATESWEASAGLGQYYEFKVLLRAGLMPKALEQRFVDEDLSLTDRYKEFYYSTGYMYARALARLAPQAVWQPALEGGASLYELLARLTGAGSGSS